MSNSSTITEDLSTPGEILVEEYLEPLGISRYRLAKDIHVDESRISRIVNGKQAISPDTAIRLSAYLGTTAEFWLNLQMHYDLMVARSHVNTSDITPAVA